MTGPMDGHMTCSDVDVVLADYIDNTLDAAGREAVEAHLQACAECAELAQDAAGFTAFVERVPSVEPPHALMKKILTEIETGPSRAVAKPSIMERLLGRDAALFLAPRFAMGAAMTALSIGMIVQVAVAESPARLLNTAENKLMRTWDRTVKGYENMAAVNDLQNQLDEWRANSEGNGAANGMPDGGIPYGNPDRDPAGTGQGARQMGAQQK